MNEKEKIEEIENELRIEIEEFKKEKERVRAMVGRIGGNKKNKIEIIINILFLIAVLVVFVLEVTMHIFPAYISLEIGVLLVSVKIVWMIHSQHKVNHFQFWVLSSIEFRISDISKRIRRLEKEILKK